MENGPDPVVDKDVFTKEFLRNKMKSRHVPLKAFILNQAVISGIGNWVADESLYQARLHPEQYCDEFSDEEMKRLYESITYVCQTACDLLADSDQFPDHWLFNHRWGKGKTTASALPNGEKLAFITVGGRTSCYAPAIQKKTGHVAPGAKEKTLEDGHAEDDSRTAKIRKPKGQEPEDYDEEKTPKKSKARKPQSHESDGEEEQRPRKKNKVKQEDVEHEQKLPGSRSAKKTKGTAAEIGTGTGRRRSARLSKAS